ncbi:transmembrane protein, putative (macronuclear) [Tetrahymena thermophila SB210]|uniref:Transmembrane protein, putative n=1 Tax=Tetrahymena thermophila (strain SB210) TaxID=312017 RepID=W7X720_TETTS|nr:transmembrane protein, putative [Tetrahymena thermophila SB210]EWS73167.1 transmembrane protein, putative [Tetrahymena thermophila SB210]|eukprot:XP_012654287.1 transmembrane protein, putative [Tetrahymena thermophila SB210]
MKFKTIQNNIFSQFILNISCLCLSLIRQFYKLNSKGQQVKPYQQDSYKRTRQPIKIMMILCLGKINSHIGILQIKQKLIFWQLMTMFQMIIVIPKVCVDLIKVAFKILIIIYYKLIVIECMLNMKNLNFQHGVIQIKIFGISCLFKLCKKQLKWTYKEYFLFLLCQTNSRVSFKLQAYIQFIMMMECFKIAIWGESYLLNLYQTIHFMVDLLLVIRLITNMQSMHLLHQINLMDSNTRITNQKLAEIRLIHVHVLIITLSVFSRQTGDVDNGTLILIKLLQRIFNSLGSIQHQVSLTLLMYIKQFYPIQTESQIQYQMIQNINKMLLLLLISLSVVCKTNL